MVIKNPAILKEISTESLLNMQKNLSQYSDTVPYGDFESVDMDDLYYDIDFELAVRGVQSYSEI